MIGIKFNGRLGNQLFQYAFFHYLRKNNRGRYFFINPHHAYLSKYFELDTFNNFTLDSKFYSLFTRMIPYVFKFKEVYIQNIQVPREVKVQNWTIYKGFYQTDWYLKHTAGNLPVKIKKQFKDMFNELYGSLFTQNKTVVVHIRRTDYLSYGKRDISLPMEYFRERLEAIDNVEEFKVIFVSDDISYVKKFFTEKENYIFSSNNEIIDFQIIMNADVAIISNSSFAWWAAYLSEKKNLVYAPKNWMGFRIGKEHPKRVMTNRFIWCDVIPRTNNVVPLT
jgi:hypothetical protein